jgi:hypothetical protein
MSNVAIFLVGLPITLAVFVAMGILAYAIKLESKELALEKRERESLADASQAVGASHETPSPAVSKVPLATDPVEIPLNAA